MCMTWLALTGVSSTRSPMGSRWVEITGQALVHVSVSEEGHVWGIDANDKIYHRVNASNCYRRGHSWEMISGELVQLSVGGAGVWGVDNDNRVFHRVGTYGDKLDALGSGWEEVSGLRLKHVAVSRGEVLGLDVNNKLHIRVGISGCNHTGLNWQSEGSVLKTVDVHDGVAWAIGSDGQARKATLHDEYDEVVFM